MITENSPASSPRLASVDDIATRYGLCRRTILNMIKDGIIPRIKLGHRTVRIPIEEADAALLRLKTGGTR